MYAISCVHKWAQTHSYSHCIKFRFMRTRAFATPDLQKDLAHDEWLSFACWMNEWVPQRHIFLFVLFCVHGQNPNWRNSAGKGKTQRPALQGTAHILTHPFSSVSSHMVTGGGTQVWSLMDFLLSLHLPTCTLCISESYRVDPRINLRLFLGLSLGHSVLSLGLLPVLLYAAFNPLPRRLCTAARERHYFSQRDFL